MSEFGDIYRRHAQEVYRFALGLCGDHHRAEDLAAEAFARALLSAGPIRGETVRAYLFTIARNLYLQSLERSRRLTPLEDRRRGTLLGLAISLSFAPLTTAISFGDQGTHLKWFTPRDYPKGALILGAAALVPWIAYFAKRGLKQAMK